MLTYGLLGAIAIRSASASASSTPGAGCASSAPSKRTPSTSSRCAAPTNHSWNGKLARRRREPGAQAVVGRGQQRRLEPERSARARAVTLESGSPARSASVRTRCSPRSRSPSWNHVSPPSRPAVLERIPGLVPAAPAALLVEHAGERVEDRVEVGRDVSPSTSRSSPTLPTIVSSAGSIVSASARREAGAAEPAGQDGDLHCVRPVRSASSAAAVLGPSRPSSCSRSPSVSTSSARFGITVDGRGNLEPLGPREEALGAVGAVERREQVRRRERERVRRPVGRGDERQAALGKRAEEREQVARLRAGRSALTTRIGPDVDAAAAPSRPPRPGLRPRRRRSRPPQRRGRPRARPRASRARAWPNVLGGRSEAALRVSPRKGTTTVGMPSRDYPAVQGPPTGQRGDRARSSTRSPRCSSSPTPGRTPRGRTGAPPT